MKKKRAPYKQRKLMAQRAKAMRYNRATIHEQIARDILLEHIRTEMECHLSMDDSIANNLKRELYLDMLPITEVEEQHPQIAKFYNRYKHIEKYSRITPSINQDKR